ncbi:MAG: DVUA0089 family protein, partial [Planctomycetaceae bacterium]
MSRRINRHNVSVAAESVEDRCLLCTPGGADPNDQICETDLTLLPGQTLPGAINPLGDVDLYAVEVFGTGDQLEFVFELNKGAGSGLDPFLRVFNEDGDELESNDDGGPGNDSELSIDFGDHGGSGTYYVGASSCGNEDYDPNVDSSGSTSGGCNTTGGYTITASDNNDEIDEALVDLNNLGTGSGFINPNTDVDLFLVTPLGGQSFKFEVDGDFDTSNNFGLDAFIRVFDDNGNELAGDDNSGGNRDAELTFTFPETGEFYVGVSSVSNQNYDIEDGSGDTEGTSTGFYTITLEEVNLDPDDTFAKAVSLGNLFVDGTLEVDGLEIDTETDVDMFEFVVGRDGSFVEIDIDRPITGVDSFIRLFDSDGKQLASNDDANAPGETGAFARDSFIGRTLDAGTYFVGVSAFRNDSYDPNVGLDDDDGGSTGAYSIQIQDRLHVDTNLDTETGT